MFPFIMLGFALFLLLCLVGYIAYEEYQIRKFENTLTEGLETLEVYDNVLEFQEPKLSRYVHYDVRNDQLYISAFKEDNELAVYCGEL